MPTKNQPNDVKPIPLEYATPLPPKGVSARRIFAATCSVFVVIISFLCLIVGIAHFFTAINDTYGRASDDIARGAGYAFLGAFCLWIAIRWAHVGFWGLTKSSERPVNRMKAFGSFLAMIACAVILNDIDFRSEKYNLDRHDFYVFIGGFAISLLLFAIGLLLIMRYAKNRPGDK